MKDHNKRYNTSNKKDNMPRLSEEVKVMNGKSSRRLAESLRELKNALSNDESAERITSDSDSDNT